jgi:hypothetical protein
MTQQENISITDSLPSVQIQLPFVDLSAPVLNHPIKLVEKQEHFYECKIWNASTKEVVIYFSRGREIEQPDTRFRMLMSRELRAITFERQEYSITILARYWDHNRQHYDLIAKNLPLVGNNAISITEDHIASPLAKDLGKEELDVVVGGTFSS